MRRLIYAVGSFLIVIAGCWAASNRTSAPGPGSVDNPLLVPQDESSAPEPTSGAPKLEPPLPTVDEEHYESFDLLRNRPLAHRMDAGASGHAIWVDANAPDFARYIQGNHRRDWLVGADVADDEGNTGTVSAVRGRVATLTMPSYGGDDAPVLEARLFNPARWENNLKISVNGDHGATVQLEHSGWNSVTAELDDVDVGADNELRFEFANLGRIGGVLSGGGFDWIRLGTPAPDDRDQGQDQAPHGLPTGQGAMSVEREQGLSWPVWLHDDARLELEIEAEPGCGPTAEIAVERGEGEVETVFRREFALVDGRGEIQSAVVDVSADESRVARLDLFVGEQADCSDVDIATARLIRPGEVDGVPAQFEPPRYVVFWVIDTLRADYLPLHFDTDVEAPNLKQLADEGVSFRNAYVQGTESRASHASLFTGLYPNRHRVMASGRVDPRLPILSQKLQDEDYATALLAANGYVSHLLNLNRGWDYYRNFIHEETALDADFLLEAGLEWLDGLDEEPFFLYFGTIDPHATYRRHDDFIGLYEPEDYRGRFQRHLSGEKLGEIKAGADPVTEREKERIINLYKNEITYNDHVFGKLREELEQRGIWEDTLVVITSDHGEEFWEHGSVGHGHNVHQEMVHVPLIFHYPRQLPRGRVIQSGGEVIDVLPTVLDMLGVEPPDDRQGMSLLPVIFGEHGGYPSPALATQYGLEYGLQIRDWKLYLRSGSMRLYDRRSDPLEMDDVRAAHPLASRWLQDAVGWFRAHRSDWDKSRWGVANNVSDEFLDLVAGSD